MPHSLSPIAGRQRNRTTKVLRLDAAETELGLRRARRHILVISFIKKTDIEYGLIRKIETTTAKMHDSQIRKFYKLLRWISSCDKYHGSVIGNYGDGLIKDHLVQRIKDEDIFNVRLLLLQPRDEYLNILNSSDISLVSLDEWMKAPCIPGKLVRLMAMKQPIIAIVPDNCETAKVIRRSKNWIVVRPGDVEGVKRAILDFGNDAEPLMALCENGRTFLETNMELNKTITRYERIFRAL